MTRLQLSSKLRTDFRKSETKKLRREGEIPATVYARGDESQAIAIPIEEMAQILKTPGGRLSLIDLKIDGKESKTHPVMIQVIQREPISKKIVHVDFHRVSMNEPVHAKVPVILVGVAPGLKQGGILEQITHELDIRALPDHIPTHIDIDVSSLELGQAIHVSDVAIPEDAELLGPAAESIVASLRMPTIHVEEVAPAAEEAEEAEGAEGAEKPAEAPAAEEATEGE